MRKSSLGSRTVAASFALVAALTGGACESEPLQPEALVGIWEHTNQQAQLTTVRQIELGESGQFTWSTYVFGPGGRPEDGLLESTVTTGDWQVRGDRLAIRSVTGFHWMQGSGTTQLDFTGEWNTQHRLRLQGGELSLTYLPTPEQSVAPYTMVYHRADGVVAARGTR